MALLRLSSGVFCGKWQVIEDLSHGTLVDCLCECGTRRLVTRVSLKFGSSKSCGCIGAKKISDKAKAKANPLCKKYKAEYHAWIALLGRCLNPNHKYFKYYGARGIGVCEKWQESFNFFIEDMGPKNTGQSLDRINNDLGYSKENCRWVDHKINCQNTRSSRRWHVNGFEYLSLQNASLALGVSKGTILGWCNGYTVKGKFYPSKDGCFSSKLYGAVHLPAA